MASEADVTTVRLNTGVAEDDATYTADYIGGLIDAGDVASATLTIWKQLAATYAKLVDVSEAGASHKFSDLFKNADAMVKRWTTVVVDGGVGVVAAPNVNYIIRE
jgi:hypothetical protein